MPPRLAIQEQDGSGPIRTFDASFTMGRSEDCEYPVPLPIVSRRHTTVELDSQGWLVRDLGSANGTYLDGKRVRDARLEGEHVLKLGNRGPAFTVSLVDTAAASSGRDAPASRPAPSRRADRLASPTSITEASAATSVETPGPAERSTAARGPEPPAGRRGANEGRSLSEYMEHYFGESGQPAGEHTQMIRQAYQVVEQKKRVRFIYILAALGVVVVLVGGYAIYQRMERAELETLALEAFEDVRRQNASILQAQNAIALKAGEPDATLQDIIRDLQQTRERQLDRYDNFVEELGYRRAPTAEERAIYRVARIFNESEIQSAIPADFIRSVRDTIAIWQSSNRFQRAVERANRLGYTPMIVETFRKYGLPPEFFYLSMQESNFNERAIGPRTRWGIAKGMWQFIPSTGEAYGLAIGPRDDLRSFDPQDDRFDPAKATDAAARYLLEIHSQLSGASSLLAMASYNWGERRVVPRLQDMLAENGITDETDEVSDRSYWAFYKKYGRIMPDETKGYVARIFAAAVIGQDPQLWGYDMENPLLPYLEGGASVDTTPRAAEAEADGDL
ncbi:MAG: transglycosylase SLT domain-containing protein [Bacteroidota bacterium]